MEFCLHDELNCPEGCSYFFSVDELCESFGEEHRDFIKNLSVDDFYDGIDGFNLQRVL